VNQLDLLAYVAGTLEDLRIPYMLVGSYASGTYGEPRMTRDIDMVVQLDPAQVEGLCARFDAREFYIRPEAARQAVVRGGQFNILHPSSGNKVDLIAARQDAWGRTQMARRQRIRALPDQDIWVARPEDIILSKMLYYKEGGSEKHLRDIVGILKIAAEDIDRDDVSHWAAELDVTDVWHAVLRRLESSLPGNR